MANSLKRITVANNVPFKNRCEYYFYERAREIFDSSSPDVDDLAFSKAIWAGQVRVVDMTKVVLTNPTIGSKVDADTEVPDSDIEYVVKTENKFHALALSYKAADLI